jgi:hypothetical protein
MDPDTINNPPPVPTSEPQTDAVTHTHVVEIHAGPNGITEIMDQEQTVTKHADPVPMVNGIDSEIQKIPAAEVTVPAPESQPQPKPHIYEMDLERMHIELYKSKYLTPNDFLNDVRKIAHNASVYADNDPDRLFKAQALLTAAEVSVLDFDQSFQMECEKMAVRERKRRETRKKAKALDRANRDTDVPSDAPTGPRRSGRNNGMEPELTITDPLQLERRLKRQRSTEDGTADRQSSSEEAGVGRTMKRSRITSDEDENDPLDVVNPSPHPVTNTVHFADEAAPVAQPMFDRNSVYASPRKMAGFDPALLNPLPSPNAPMTLIIPPINGRAPSPSTPMAITPIPQRINSPNPFLSATVNEQPAEPSSQPQKSNSPAAAVLGQSPVPAPPQEAMMIERTPTPLPDFHVDEAQLSQLKQVLGFGTQPLNVEELEQLRATCLGAVWRHRAEWDRGELMRELLNIVHEFLQEVHTDNMSMSP